MAKNCITHQLAAQHKQWIFNNQNKITQNLNTIEPIGSFQTIDKKEDGGY